LIDLSINKKILLEKKLNESSNFWSDEFNISFDDEVAIHPISFIVNLRGKLILTKSNFLIISIENQKNSD
jgi:hypothetical protein